MSTKSTIQTLINTNLADSSDILASEHRAVENALLNELYPDIVNESDSGVDFNITDKNTINTDLGYNIYIIKQGRLVTIKGEIINNSEIIISDEADNYFFEIIGSDYIPHVDSSEYWQPSIDISGVAVPIKIVNNKLYLATASSSPILNFSLTYFTQN